MRDATCVVLAAGRATRMGGEKLLLPFREGTILEAVLRACADYPTLLVASTAIAISGRLIERLATAENRLTVVVNDAPERGMSYSLRLANREIEPQRAIAVLLGDKPLVSAELIGRLLDAIEGYDVVYPARAGVPGHPVVFSRRARSLIEGLPDGDTLQALRDDPRLAAHAVPVDDEGAYADVDTEEDYRKIARDAPP
jgi:molybdenum cofactor cytidylyltransferase